MTSASDPAPVIDPMYEVLALRYAASLPGRTRADNFLHPPDPHDALMPMDYFLWAIRGAGRLIVVDTGFEAVAAERRARRYIRHPTAALLRAGIDPTTVTDVILTHLHYDHAGCLTHFPQARFHVQDAEMAYATGRQMCHACLRAAFEADDVADLVRLVYRDRVTFHQGDSTVAPGISLHLVGGHTAGLQVVKVQTRRGGLVLASDACHFTANRLLRNPFPIVFNVGDMLEGHAKCEALAGGRENLLVPGHDPDVLRRWPVLSAGDPDTVCLHEAPVQL